MQTLTVFIVLALSFTLPIMQFGLIGLIVGIPVFVLLGVPLIDGIFRHFLQ